jgi:two-component system, chemotaxis family, CheB/CheR fusion protein
MRGPAEYEGELADLKARLKEAEDTLRALRSGEVDALVVEGENGPQIFTLKSAAEPYRLLVEQMREGALTLSRRGDILYCNEAFGSLVGEASSHIVGSSILKYIDKCDFDRLAEPTGCEGCEMIVSKAAGGHAVVSASAVPLAVEGQPVISAVITDLTGYKVRMRYQAIMEAIDQPVYSLSRDLVIESWNPGAEKLYGYAATEMIGRPESDLCPPDECEALQLLASEVAASGESLAGDARRRRQDGSTVHVIFCLAPLRDGDGALTGYAAIAHDITERKAQEKTRQLLLDELNHRVKNTLAMVQAIARLTLRQSKSPENFAESFTGRIQALAGAHDVLTASSWHGAVLRSLVNDQLILGEGGEGRFHCIGPEIKLNPQAAIGLSLVLHELGTNANKYGALSIQDGHVDLTWRLEEAGAVLSLRWQEVGGPPVSAPSRRGFGTFIIEQSLNNLDGVADLCYPSTGFVCELRLPLKAQKTSEAS